MPYSRETDYFTYEFEGGYKIFFYPAYHTGTPANEISFDSTHFMEEGETSAESDNDLPFGLPKAREWNLKLDLRRFTGDFADVAQWIIECKGQDLTLKNSNMKENQTVKNYNHWILEKNGTILFSGFQVPNPKRKFKASKYQIPYEFSIIGAEKSVWEVVRWDNLELTSTTSYTDYIHDIYYDDGGAMSMKTEKSNFAAATINHISTCLKNYYEYIYTQMTRKGGVNPVFVDFDLTKVWTLHAQDLLDDGVAAKGAVLTFSNLRLVVSDGNVEAGILSEASDSFFNYSNLWSFLRSFYDALLLKGEIGYRDGDGCPLLSIHRPYAAIDANKDVSNLDIGEADTQISPLQITKATATIIGVKAEGEKELTEVVTDDTGTLDGQTQNSPLPLHNYIINHDSSKTRFSTGGSIKSKLNFSSRGIYYEDDFFGGTVTSLGLIHSHCICNMGDGKTFESDTTYQTHKYIQAGFNEAIATANQIATNQKRYPYYGIGRERNRAILDMLTKDNHAIVEVELADSVNATETISSANLFETYTVDLSSIFEFLPFSEIGTKAILVSVKTDLVKRTHKCKFFVR